jgi:DNA-binding CsgD family transcriptional regulator
VRRTEGTIEPRFTLLETVRQFGEEQLEARGEAEAVRTRHAAYMEGLALQAEPDVMLGRFAGGWFARLDEERDNLRAALAWSLQMGDAERVLAIAGAVADYWCFRGDFAEGRSWYDQAFALAGEGSRSAGRRAAHFGVAELASFQGEIDASVAAGETMLSLAKMDAAPIDIIRAHFVLSLALRRHDRVAEAIAHGHAALALARALPSPGWIAWTLSILGEIPGYAGAEAAGEEALDLFREVGSEWGLVNALVIAAVAAVARGDWRLAAALNLESLNLRQVIDDRCGMIDSLTGTAQLAVERGHFVEAAQLLGAAVTRAATLGYAIYDTHPTAPATTERVLRELDEPTFAAARDYGASLGLSAAIDLARALLTRFVTDNRTLERANAQDAAVTGGRSVVPGRSLAPMGESEPQSPVVSRPESGLTFREQDVLALLCQRLTDPEIAERLYISPKTVGKHVSNILGKLGASNRREAAAIAARHTLV